MKTSSIAKFIKNQIFRLFFCKICQTSEKLILIKIANICKQNKQMKLARVGAKMRG